jgi:hypothetical protein
MIESSGSAAALEAFLAKRGVDFQTGTLDEIVTAVVDFYEVVDASGLIPEPGGDMLLFQFGTYDRGNGERFNFDITRQFIIAGEDDDVFSQLHCTLFYESTDVLRAIGAGARWSKSRDELVEFRAFIVSSSAYEAVRALSSRSRQIGWELV